MGIQKNRLNETDLLRTKKQMGVDTRKPDCVQKFLACEQQNRRPALASAQSDQHLWHKLCEMFAMLVKIKYSYNKNRYLN